MTTGFIGSPAMNIVEVVSKEEGFPFEVMVVEEFGSDAYAYGALHLGGDAGGAATAHTSV